MYRIRFHGRGGQGMKTASRILGSAFFMEGYEVQDAPRYGAERRGAPIFAYVRADQKPVNERGVINQPDLVVVSDDTLVGMPAAGVMQGVGNNCVLLINSHESAETWKHRLNTSAKIIILPAREDVEDRAELPYVSSMCAAASAALTGVVAQETLEKALTEELGHLGERIIAENLSVAITAFEQMKAYAGVVKKSSLPSAIDYEQPDWIDLPFESAAISTPAIHSGLTSVKVRTGLWRTMRPIIDYEKCSGCWWVCSTYCPDSTITVNAQGLPEIDYDHCKGCMICVAQCPPHAIEAIPEHAAKDSDVNKTAAVQSNLKEGKL